MSNFNSNNPYCSQLSAQSGEPIFGTATAEITTWFLLEYTQSWGAKAVDDNDLPEPVQQWLAQQLDGLGHGRLLFIKQQARKRRNFAFYVVRSTEKAQAIYRFTLEKYSDLLDLDFSGDFEKRYLQNRSQAQLLLVCTNGKRDRCCAKFGRPLYETLASELAESSKSSQSVWQCTHIGGHRYAATMVAFPSAVFYGHLAPAHAEALCTHIGRGELMLNHYRGRSYYPTVVQAADFFLRNETGERSLAAYRWLDAAETAEGQWTITFEETGSYQLHDIVLEATFSKEKLLASCNTPKYKPQPVYKFEEHRVRTAQLTINSND